MKISSNSRSLSQPESGPVCTPFIVWFWMETFCPVLPGFHPLISGGSGENDFPGGEFWKHPLCSRGLMKTSARLSDSGHVGRKKRSNENVTREIWKRAVAGCGGKRGSAASSLHSLSAFFAILALRLMLHYYRKIPKISPSMYNPFQI